MAQTFPLVSNKSVKMNGEVIPRRTKLSQNQGGLSVLASGFDEDPFETSESDTDLDTGLVQYLSHPTEKTSQVLNKPIPPSFHFKKHNYFSVSDMGLDLEDEMETSTFGQSANLSNTAVSIQQSLAYPIGHVPLAQHIKPKAHVAPAADSESILKETDNQSVSQKTLAKSNSNLDIQNNTAVQPLDHMEQIISLQKTIEKYKAESRIKDKEIASLRKEVVGSQTGFPVGGADNTVTDMLLKPNMTKDAKVIELAKKARRLTVAYERERSMNATLQIQLKQQREAAVSRQEIESDDLKKLPRQSEIKVLKDKIAQITRKLEEERIAGQSLKSDIRLAQKALLLEIGDDAPIQNIVKGDVGGWKGRAEQIALLKDKVKELSRKLAKMSSNSRISNANFTGEADHYDLKNRESIQKIESTRKSDLDKAIAELEQSRSNTSSIKSKCDALVARNRILEREVKDLRTKIGVLLRKGENDDRLIQALKQDAFKTKSDAERGQAAIFDRLRLLCADQEGQIQQLQTQLQEASNTSDCVKKHFATQTTPENIIPASEQTPQMNGLQSIIHSLKLEIESLRTLNSELEQRLNIFPSPSVNCEIERKAPSSCLKDGKTKKRTTTEEHAIPKQQDAIRMQNKLDLLVNENEALKMSIQSINDAKAKDLDMYKELLDTTRSMFDRDIKSLVDRLERQS
ncbi:hypothetical protein O5D80_006501 [Batrachochytrium dendrobatidis]|nr:hypothetical protein O5D80_006501 [Batrachochytrium dendrobatidis]